MNHDVNHFRKEVDGWDENSIVPGLSINGLIFIIGTIVAAAFFMWLSPINWDKVVDSGFYAVWRAPWTFLGK
ncbi:MAG: hypothetical protein WA058_00350 [Minisyncoccia bacterium]